MKDYIFGKLVFVYTKGVDYPYTLCMYRKGSYEETLVFKTDEQFNHFMKNYKNVAGNKHLRKQATAIFRRSVRGFSESVDSFKM